MCTRESCFIYGKKEVLTVQYQLQIQANVDTSLDWSYRHLSKHVYSEIS